MSFDLYAELASQSQCPATAELPAGLASGFVDGCTSWSTRGGNAKNEARNRYMKHAQVGELTFPKELASLLDPMPRVLQAGWLAIEVAFTLEAPWYSKDDRPFHVLDNPVRKDRVFGVPYMAAASWKGMLRWACRMHAGLHQYLTQGRRFEEWPEPSWVLHLFGNEKGTDEDFRQGALVFYPTWFDRIGFEVINPHDRSRRAGTQPIYYEVVPGRRPDREGGKGTLRLLYAPWPGMNNLPKRSEWLPVLLQSIEDLLIRYGISAKRTVGWGTADIKKWRAWRKDTPAGQPIEADSRYKLLNELGLAAGGG